MVSTLLLLNEQSQQFNTQCCCFTLIPVKHTLLTQQDAAWLSCLLLCMETQWQQWLEALCIQVFCPSITLVNLRNALRKFLQIWLKRPLRLKDLGTALHRNSRIHTLNYVTISQKCPKGYNVGLSRLWKKDGSFFHVPRVPRVSCWAFITLRM